MIFNDKAADDPILRKVICFLLYMKYKEPGQSGVMLNITIYLIIEALNEFLILYDFDFTRAKRGKFCYNT